MQHISARDAKNKFGHLIDVARVKPVAIEKHGRPVVIVLSVEAYDHLLNRATPSKRAHQPKKLIRPQG